MTTSNTSASKQQEGKKKPASTTLSLNDFRKETPVGAITTQSRHDDFTWALDSNNDLVNAKKQHETLLADHRRSLASAAHSASARSFAFRTDDFVPPNSASTSGPQNIPTNAPYIAFLKNLPSTNTTSEAISAHLFNKVNIKPKRTRVISKGIAVIAFTELDSYSDLCLLLSLRTIGFGGRLIPITVANESQRNGSDRLFDVSGTDGGDAAERSWSELSVSTPGSSVKSASASFAIPRSPAIGIHPHGASNTPPPQSTQVKTGTKPLWRPRNANGSNTIPLLSREHMGNEAQQPAVITHQSSGNNSFVSSNTVNRLSIANTAIATDKDNRHRAFIGNLSPTVTESEVAGFFVDIGVDVKYISPLTTDKQSGSAFTHVDFGDDEQLQHILSQNGKQMLGRPMTITLPKNVSQRPSPPPPPTITRDFSGASSVATSTTPKQLFGMDRNRFGAFADRKDSSVSSHNQNTSSLSAACEPTNYPSHNSRAYPPSPPIGSHAITGLRRTDSCETLSSYGGTSSVSVAPTPAVTPGGDNWFGTHNAVPSASSTPPPKLMLSDPAPPMSVKSINKSHPDTSGPPALGGSDSDPFTTVVAEDHNVNVTEQCCNGPCAYVGNLPSTTTEASLNKHFSEELKISAVSVHLHHKGPTTFAFVEFSTNSELALAVAFNGSLLDGRAMRIVAQQKKVCVAPATGAGKTGGRKTHGVEEGVDSNRTKAPLAHATATKDEGASHHRTYIGNLPTGTTEDELKRHFADAFHLSVVCARVRTKGPTTFAFVDFASGRDQSIAASKSGAMLSGRPMRIVISDDLH